MFVKSIAVVAVFASFVAAQSNTTIDPSSVDPTLRSQWCQGETNTCGTLCSGAVNENGCDPDTLDYNCTCTSNNSAPGLQYYTETIPTFICEKIFQNCNAANVGDAAAQALCMKNEKANCGQLNPNNFTEVAATTSSAAAGSTATSSAASSGAAATSTSSSKAAGATMAPIHQFGTGAMAVGMAAAFGYML